MLQIGGHKEFFSQKHLPIMVFFFQFTLQCITWKSLKIVYFVVIKNVLMKNNKNETEKLMDVRKKSLSPNKKSNAEPALKVRNHHLELPDL